MPSDNKYSKLVKNLLTDVNKRHKELNESGVRYDGKHSERMHQTLEQALRTRQHSLGEHPAFPEGDEQHFEEKIMSDRFKDVVKNAKKHFNSDNLDGEYLMTAQLPLLSDCIKTEQKHRKDLEELAIKMIREEFDIPEEAVEITAELVDRVTLEGTRKNPDPIEVKDMDFDSHQSIAEANAEVYKRRLLNAMIQGAAKKNHHMFHMVDDELTDMDPKLPNLYAKTMAAADYMYYLVDRMDEGVPGGVVRVELPKKEGDIPKIHVQALIFPVLIHELAKGAMEILSVHGLPEDAKLQKFVMAKADFLSAEPWDMRLGPALWERFTKSFEPEDFKYKQYVYVELAKLPVHQFNEVMKEIFAGTKRGKQIVKDMVDEVKGKFKQHEFNEAMNMQRAQFEEKKYLGPDDFNFDMGDLYK